MSFKTFRCDHHNGSINLDALENSMNGWCESNPSVKIIGIYPVTARSHQAGFLVHYESIYNHGDKKQLPTIPSEQIPTCPDCDSVMRLRARNSDGGLFFGCSKFPECKGIRSYEDRINKINSELPLDSEPDPYNSDPNEVDDLSRFDDDIPF